MEELLLNLGRPLKSIVVLTGAGISAESGIPTFRASDGLWENHSITDVATPEGFERNPSLVHEFYNQRRKALLTLETCPNQAHSALARFQNIFENRHHGDFTLITQNIDDLHERAGSLDVIHMHGKLLQSRCSQSGLIFSQLKPLNVDSVCRCCQTLGNLRPHIVWFGELPLEIPIIEKALTTCDLFVAIGTSGQVYPAAGLYEQAKTRGAHTLEINLVKTKSNFDAQLLGNASDLVPSFFSKLASQLELET